ncbi:hypothetical protein DFH08DRAFT_858218 [Mycena albidolilacea]|uniref:Uncharacterized protein n=1 Tax=Mycena albidolilacea TaxID=1033008 RepID=A0AAD7A8V6_9AGAR|nr:hypothetical protein DFH08DRAFT_858218 [Mycena albidolilacea]
MRSAFPASIQRSVQNTQFPLTSFNLKNLVFVAVLCLAASTEVFAIECTPCVPPRRDLAVKVMAGRKCCTDPGSE